MAGIRITDLDALGATPADDDVLIIVDTNENQTKQVTVSELLAGASAAETAAVAAQIVVQEDSSNDLFYLTFVDSVNGAYVAKTDSDLNYNPNLNVLSAPFFSGNGSLLGNVKADSALNASFALVAANALSNADDSALGVRIYGETTIDSDLYVKGVIHAFDDVLVTGTLYGDGSGLTGITSTAVTTTAEQTDAKILDSNGVHYLMLRTKQTGYDSVSTISDLVYDPQTNILSASFFSGDGSNLTNISADSATLATSVKVTAVTSADSSTYYPHLGSISSGNDNVNVNTGLTYIPSTQKLSTSIFSTANWEMYESANKLFFAYQGVKKVKIDSDGNVFMAGTLTQSASL